MVHDSLALSAKLAADESTKYLVLDYSDAFYMMPVARSELRYCGAWYHGCWYVWLVAPQGSVNGPSVDGRLAVLTARMGQGLTDSTELRTQLYVDDPCSTVRGTPERSERLVAILIFLWLVLGWRLAHHKGQYGRQIEWA